MSKLSIVVTCLDDSDLPNTLQSIRETAGDAPEIVVVEDSSNGHNLGAFSNLKHVRNSKRVGVGPSRYIGLQHASGQYVMLADSHLRFMPGWYEKLLVRLESRPKTLTCFECRAIDSERMDANNPKAFYYGATFNIFGPDPIRPHVKQIFEPNWLRANPGDDAEIPCVLGGAYAATKEWMLLCAGSLRFLRQWSDDEANLSLRSWMYGGDVRIMSTVGIAHKFLLPHEKQPYKVSAGNPQYNRLFTIHTLLPPPLQEFLFEKLQLHQGGGELVIAKQLIESNWNLVETEKAFVQAHSLRDFHWLSDRFKL